MTKWTKVRRTLRAVASVVGSALLWFALLSIAGAALIAYGLFLMVGFAWSLIFAGAFLLFAAGYIRRGMANA